MTLLEQIGPLKSVLSSTHLGVVLEAAGGLAGREIPEAEGLVPRAGEGEVAVGGEHHVGHEVAVAVQPLLRDAVLGLIPGRNWTGEITYLISL